MNKSVLYVLIYLGGVLLAALAQTLLKKSANREYGNFLREYLNRFVLGGYALFFISTLCTLMAFRWLPLSVGAVLGATGYVFVPVLSALVLKEKMTRRKIVGLVVVLVGIGVITLG